MPRKILEAVTHVNSQVKTLNAHPVPWIWDGLIAENAVTLLSAPEKTGKTTLLSLLLHRRHQGGELLGRQVRPGRTILCSEENHRLWALRQPPLEFGDELEFCRPADDPPTLVGWGRFIDHLIERKDEAPLFDLLVIDTAMRFLPPVQRNAGALREALDDLRLIAGAAGILLLHQSRTFSRPLAAFADILIDMQLPPGDHFTRRRHFTGISRYPGALQHVTAELNPEGTDYILLPPEPPEPALTPTLDTVQQLLRDAPEPLTRQEILTRWPERQPPPRADSLWRTLTHGCKLGVLVRTGEGTKAEAFRYGLARHPQ